MTDESKKTENSIKKAGQVKCPICGTIYYPSIEGECPNKKNHPKD